ncbi:hypothetical protein PFMC_00523 [Plasmodium falciparum CAMP/Malaysia]|uniref:Uncharacterized protein n=1 Tax=Plasmodium falciparum (isolate Camp / Malaysia) TaxID=5835 RepID=A0A024XER8_PLAFC|nr:hypothetical protein PFMC_00523 [Plasmodium falciparum CAMP/Malaysia]
MSSNYLSFKWILLTFFYATLFYKRYFKIKNEKFISPKLTCQLSGKKKFYNCYINKDHIKNFQVLSYNEFLLCFVKCSIEKKKKKFKSFLSKTSYGIFC